MAARESQGLQIALILFVMIAVVLAVTTYIFFSKSEQNFRDLQAAKATADTNLKKANAYEAAYELTKRTVGRSSKNDAELGTYRSNLPGYDAAIAADVAEIEKRYDNDMKMYGVGLTAETVSYVDLPQNLTNVINQRNELVEQLRKDLAALDQKSKNDLAAEQAKTAAAAKAQEDAQASLDSQQTLFDKDRSDKDAEMQKLVASAAEKDKRFKTAQDNKDSRINALAGEKDALKSKVDILNDLIRGQNQEKFDLPSGKVTFVNQSAGSVWLNLGTADGLQRNTTFTVYDRDQTNFANSKTKGVVEVTKVVGEHLAEARIVDESYTNPILSGDMLYTPTWSPGDKVRFALIGFMDIDGDTLSDRDQVRSLILTNGGLIDAEVDDDGNRTGAITPATRYLVIGKDKRVADPSKSKALIDERTKIFDEADANGLQRIELSKFLSMMGYKADRRTMKLGLEGVDLKAEPPQAGGSVKPGAAVEEAGEEPSGDSAVEDPFAERSPLSRDEESDEDAVGAGVDAGGDADDDPFNELSVGR
jgi:hypothetical protein